MTVGWEIDEVKDKSKQVIKTVGCYATRAETEQALNEYLADPYNIESKDITFEQLYEEWSEKYFPTLSVVSSVRSVESAFRYVHSIINLPQHPDFNLKIKKAATNIKGGNLRSEKSVSVIKLPFQVKWYLPEHFPFL